MKTKQKAAAKPNDEQVENANIISEMISAIEEVDQKAIDSIVGKMKGMSLSRGVRTEVNKWLREANGTVNPAPKEETRGKKAPEVSMLEIRTDIKEALVKLAAYHKQAYAKGKSVTRISSAKRTLNRLLKYQLTE